MVASSMILSLGVLAQSLAATDPARLIDQLGSSRFAEREAATRALEELGGPAIPFLQTGGKSKDLEIRTRSAGILRRVEGRLLTRATPVHLDFDRAPLPEVIRALGERSGMSLALVPEALPRWRSDRVTIRDAGTVPFWQAVDRVCEAVGLHADLETRGPARGGTALAFSLRGSQPVYPRIDEGPFRVRLKDLQFIHKLQFAPASTQPGSPVGNDPGRGPEPAQPRPAVRILGTVQLDVQAEPRLSLNLRAPMRLLEARDERGNSLLVPADTSSNLARAGGYAASSCTSVLQLQAAVQRPADCGKLLRSLRGTVPLRITARRPDPLVVKLDGAAGKTFSKDDLSLTIHEVRSDPKLRRRQIELSIQGGRRDIVAGTTDASTGELGVRGEPLQQSLEVVDERGRSLPWFQTVIDMESNRVTLTLHGVGNELGELRYYRITEAATDVAFSFSDIPIP
ncbi:MAG: hypothetical protein U0790_13435 [Isosphaeraceae bacterium]